MNLMYYRMVNGVGYYPSAVPTATPTPGAGILGSGATAAASPATLGGAAAAASPLTPKWIVPNFSATQIQYMFRHRMDKGAKINKAVKCDTCSITLNSEQQAQQHYSGKNHLKKLRQIGKKKDGDSDKDSSERRRSKDRLKKRDKNGNRNKDDDADDDPEGGEGSPKPSESVESKSEKDDDDEVDDSSDDDDDDDDDNKSKETDKSTDIIKSRASDSVSETNDTEEQNDSDLEGSEVTSSKGDLVESEIATSSCQLLSQSETECNKPNSGEKGGINDGPEANTSDTQNQGLSERVGTAKAGSDDPEVEDNTSNSLQTPTEASHDTAKSPSPSSSSSSSCTSQLQTLQTSMSSTSQHITVEQSQRSRSNSPHFNVPKSSEPEPKSFLMPKTVTLPSAKHSSNLIGSSAKTCQFRPHVSIGTARSPISPMTSVASRYPSSTRMSRSVKRPYESPSKNTYMPCSLSSQSRCSPAVISGLTPPKMARTSYVGSLAGMDVRSPAMMNSPHLALTPNSIPGYTSLQPQMRHLTTDQISTGTQPLALLRPMVHPTGGATTMASALSSYTNPQYASTYTGAVNPGSYAYQYQALTPSDLNSVQRGMLNPYYHDYTAMTPTQNPTHQQTGLLTQTTPDPLSIDQSLVPSDFMTSGLFPTSKDLMGGHMTLKYASSVPTSSALPSAYQYGASIQAISIQAMGTDPGMGMLQGSTASPYNSTPSPPYLSLSGVPNGTAVVGAVATPIQTPVSLPALAAPASSVTRIANSLAQGQGQGLLQTQKQTFIQSATYQTQPVVKPVAPAPQQQQGSDNKLDPVAQAVYDNVLGKLPTKRKKEIPCGVCDMVFNSQVQADAHFSGSKHAKKQKVSTDEDLGPHVSAKSWGKKYSCSLCSVTLNSWMQLEAHKQGQQHKNRESGLPGNKTPGVDPSLSASSTSDSSGSLAWNEVEGNQGGWFYCINCNISVATAMALQQHIRRDKHKNAVKQSKIASADHSSKDSEEKPIKTIGDSKNRWT